MRSTRVVRSVPRAAGSRSVAMVVAASLLVLTAVVLPSGSTAASTPLGTVTIYDQPDLGSPAGITVGPDGALWFSDYGGNRIGRITTEGAVSFFSGAGIAQPAAIVTGSDGNLWFISSTFGVITRMTPAGVVTPFAHPQVIAPSDLAVGPDGNLWFVDAAEETVGKMTPAGAVTLYPALTVPERIVAGPDGRLWYSGPAQIAAITTEGVRTGYGGPGLSNFIHLAAGPDGNVWFADQGNSRIGRVSPTGTVTTFESLLISEPVDLTAGADGAMWFIDGTNGTVGRITVAGSVSSVAAPGVTGLRRATSGPDGRVWFTSANGKIGAVGTAGTSGLLRVTTSPALPAAITVDGIVRDEWGLNWVEMPAGVREVCFGPVPGFAPPPCEQVLLTEGGVVELTGSYTQRGYLRVVTDPAVPANIFVGGVVRNAWGLWTEVDVGDHLVCFPPLANYAYPPQISGSAGQPSGLEYCYVASVSAGSTTTVTASFTYQEGAPGAAGSFGELRVTTSPAVASRIQVDGDWRDTWGLTWLRLPYGTYDVCFEDVPAVTMAGCSTVEVVTNQVTEVVGDAELHGYLRVLTSPAVASTISIDGQPANAWGVWSSRPPGTYEVCFGDVAGALTPSCRSVEVQAGQTATTTGTFTPNP